MTIVSLEGLVRMRKIQENRPREYQCMIQINDLIKLSKTNTNLPRQILNALTHKLITKKMMVCHRLSLSLMILSYLRWRVISMTSPIIC